jgi:hypothetical protein
MDCTRGIAKLGMLAVGLGIGAAIASVPGTAAADSSTDWLSSIDSLLSGAAVPAADTTSAPLNLAISMDGVTVFQTGSAEAYSGTTGDIAIANGADTSAYAFGTDNYADILGNDSSGVAGGYNAAEASGSTDDTAFIDGNNDYAYAGGDGSAHPGTFDYAVIFGNDEKAYSGGDAAGAGSYDGAYVEGNDLGTAYAQGANYLADILKFYGTSADQSTSAASESTNLLSALDGGSAGDSSNFLTDLLGSFDGAGAAADSSHLLSELASLF